MSFYDFDIKKAVVETLPPDKRYNNNVNYLRALLKPLQWARDLYFGSYYEGINTPYAPGAYNYEDQVSYQGKVYESLIDANTDLPTTSNWRLIQDDFIGAKERSMYTNQKLVFEYALNREFSTTFRQPPLVSDIFIENENPNIDLFYVGATEPFCSTVGATNSSSFVGISDNVPVENNLKINIPTATQAIYGDLIIESVIAKYVCFGLDYIIIYY